MSAGDNPAGVCPAGYDPTTPSTFTPAAIGKAAKFDPESKAYVLAADKSVELDHPVMQEVSISLGIRKGSLRSSPTTGIDDQRLRRSTSETAQAVAEQEVTLALRAAIDRGDVLVERVIAVMPWRGLVFSDVRNLRDPDARPVRFAVGGQAR